jgi:hypothetical protein
VHDASFDEVAVPAKANEANSRKTAIFLLALAVQTGFNR